MQSKKQILTNASKIIKLEGKYMKKYVKYVLIVVVLIVLVTTIVILNINDIKLFTKL